MRGTNQLGFLFMTSLTYVAILFSRVGDSIAYPRRKFRAFNWRICVFIGLTCGEYIFFCMFSEFFANEGIKR